MFGLATRIADAIRAGAVRHDADAVTIAQALSIDPVAVLLRDVTEAAVLARAALRAPLSGEPVPA